MNDSGVGGCLNPDPVLIVPDVWEGLIAEYHPRTVLDVGCGYGHAVAWFLHHGIYAFGLDGYPPAIEKSMAPAYVALHDFTSGPTGGRLTYDLCWCAEFVEHVEERYIPNYAECFTRCNILAMTHAIPGQPGFHHVNCQYAEYWIEKMKEYKLQYDNTATHKFRRWALWGVNTLLIFVNELQPNPRLV